MVPSPQPTRAAKVTEGSSVLKCQAQQEPVQGSSLPLSHDLCPEGGGVEGAQLSILGTWGFTSVALPLPPLEAFRPLCLSDLPAGLRTHLAPTGAPLSTPTKPLFTSGLGQLQSPQHGRFWPHF